MMNPLARQRDRPRKSSIEARHQQLLVKHKHHRHDQHRDPGHQPDVILANRRRLAEHELVDAALVAGGQVLDHREQTDAHGKKRCQRQAKRRVLLDLGRPFQGVDKKCPGHAGNHRAAKNQRRVLGDVVHVETPVEQPAGTHTGKQKAKRNAGQHRVRQRVADERHLAHHDETAQQPARDAEQHRANHRVAYRRITERKKTDRLLAKRCLLRHVADLRRPGALRQNHKDRQHRQQAKRVPCTPSLLGQD